MTDVTGWRTRIHHSLAPKLGLRGATATTQPANASQALVTYGSQMLSDSPTQIQAVDLSNRYQLWWERATDSYKRLATEARFGLRGTLNVELSATGPLVGTIDFTLVSPDKTLPEIAEAEALLGHSLLFAGDEVLWAWGFTLVGANRYTAQLLRARYGSLRMGHGIGDSVVLFFPTDDRHLAVHKMAFEARTQRFKVQPWLFQLSRDLADCAPVSHAIQLRAYRPLAPLNLRVQGDGQ